MTNPWDKRAQHLQSQVRNDELHPVDYSDEQVRQGIIHAREDVVFVGFLSFFRE